MQPPASILSSRAWDLASWLHSMETPLQGSSHNSTYIDADLEDAVISAIAADPTWYWAIRERFPAAASDVFVARRETWDQLTRAIESGSSTTEPSQAAAPSTDPLHAAERLVELYWRRTLAHLTEETQYDLLASRP